MRASLAYKQRVISDPSLYLVCVKLKADKLKKDMLKFCLLKIFYLSNIFFNTELLIISKINENKLIILRLTAKINT